MRFRPWTSARRPKIGVVTTNAIWYAANTHEYSARPPNAPTMVGIAVPTAVESIAARNMPSIAAMVMTARRDVGGDGADTGAAPAAVRPPAVTRAIPTVPAP